MKLEPNIFNRINSFAEYQKKMTDRIASAQDSTLQGGSSSGHINYIKNVINCKYVKKLKMIFINAMVL